VTGRVESPARPRCRPDRSFRHGPCPGWSGFAPPTRLPPPGRGRERRSPGTDPTHHRPTVRTCRRVGIRGWQGGQGCRRARPDRRFDRNRRDRRPRGATGHRRRMRRVLRIGRYAVARGDGRLPAHPGGRHQRRRLVTRGVAVSVGDAARQVPRSIGRGCTAR